MNNITSRENINLSQVVANGFYQYNQVFKQYTHASKARFENRQWKQQRQALQERTDRLEQLVQQTTSQVLTHLNAVSNAEKVLKLQEAFLTKVAQTDKAVAYCFFDALLPQLLPASWYKLFILPHTSSPPEEEMLRYLDENVSLQAKVKQLLVEIGFETSFADLEEDAYWISKQLKDVGIAEEKVDFLVLPSLFYRNQHAYLLGYIHQGDDSRPIAIAFIHPTGGIQVDAVLLSESSIKNLFAFSRSYFLVDTQHPISLVKFIHSILPSKPLAQLFINIGFAQYGKTLLYYHLIEHLLQSQEKFTYPQGIPGMVMLVFTLPTFPVVIKVLRDNCKPPKNVSQRQVIDKYQYIAQHDRVGRMADAQRFNSLVLPEWTFEVSLLEELTQEASQSVRVHEGKVEFSLAYMERKMIPLDVFLKSSSLEQGRQIIVEYGHAIREIAMSNVFPGDLLLKNFGVTPEGRVVFYDYDEVVPLTDCYFRSIPLARYEEDELADDPWFAVGENDIFPQELIRFLVPSGPLRDAFCHAHADLLTPQFWNEWKTFFLSGGITDLAPYENGKASVSA